MSDGVAASAGTIRARFNFSTVPCIFAYRAIIGAILISGYVTCGATVIANHPGVTRDTDRYESVGIEVQMVGLNQSFQSK